MGTHYKGTAKEKLALDTYIKLNRATNSVNRRHFLVTRQHGLTSSQFAVMEALLHLGPQCQRSISEKVLLSTGNLTTVIDNLESHGWVTRTRDKVDRRMVMIDLTDTGRSIIEPAFQLNLKLILEEFAILSESEQAELSRLCKILGTQAQMPVESMTTPTQESE